MLYKVVVLHCVFHTEKRLPRAKMVYNLRIKIIL